MPAAAEQHGRAVAQPARERLRRADVDHLVVAAETFARGLRESTTVLLSGCGHMPLMAQPRQVAEAVVAFVRR